MNVNAKILLTTSRNPTPKIRSFCNDIARVVPNIALVNRGKMSMNDLAEKALETNADRAVIIDRWERGIGRIEFFQVSSGHLTSVPPILFIADVKLQREIAQTRLKPIHSLVMTQPTSTSNSVQLADALTKFFSVPTLSEKKAASNYQAAIRISRNAKERVQVTFTQLPNMVEVGPRMTLGRVEWERAK